jgi:hypothetical protein
MMKTLHLLMSKPTPRTEKLIEIMSRGEKTEEIHLYKDDTDYDKLLDLIFDYDRVISW